jgi:hypothetical protein
MGWVTNVTEYSNIPTIKTRMSVTITTTKAQALISISSAVRRWLGCCIWSYLFFEDGGYQVFRTLLSK